MKSSLKILTIPVLLTVSLALSACGDAPEAGSESSNRPSNNANLNAPATTHTQTDSDNPIVSNPNGSQISANNSSQSGQSIEEQMIDELNKYRWTLIRATDNDNTPLTALTDIKDQVTLKFSQYEGDHMVNYSVGCNTISANYELQNTSLVIGEGMSTKMSCGAIDSAENNLNENMHGNHQISLTNNEQPILTQVANDMTTLMWEGRLTAQAKYNGKGETIFWAVKAATEPCLDEPAKSCLQVKPITYNDAGLQTSAGEWISFAGQIDGYNHDNTHTDVLRLQRYRLDPTEKDTVEAYDADQQYAYVLDAIIESTVVES